MWPKWICIKFYLFFLLLFWSLFSPQNPHLNHSFGNHWFWIINIDPCLSYLNSNHFVFRFYCLWLINKLNLIKLCGFCNAFTTWIKAEYHNFYHELSSCVYGWVSQPTIKSEKDKLTINVEGKLYKFGLEITMASFYHFKVLFSNLRKGSRIFSSDILLFKKWSWHCFKNWRDCCKNCPFWNCLLTISETASVSQVL